MAGLECIMEREEYLQVYRHSLAHVLAKAVIEIYGKENVQYAIGPQIADGFYYDFTLPEAVTKDDYDITPQETITSTSAEDRTSTIPRSFSARLSRSNPFRALTGAAMRSAA